jgi:hypothetical protein
MSLQQARQANAQSANAVGGSSASSGGTDYDLQQARQANQQSGQNKQ